VSFSHLYFALFENNSFAGAETAVFKATAVLSSCSNSQFDANGPRIERIRSLFYPRKSAQSVKSAVDSVQIANCWSSCHLVIRYAPSMAAQARSVAS
jgi:hypothetical protein